jgi:hypothetical protein
MSKLEIRFNNLIKENKLPYSFVGNGKILVGNKSPDFVHLNKNIAIEVFDKKHKDLFRNGGCRTWMNARKQYFNNLGWDIEFFNEKMLCNRIVNEVLLKHEQ